MEQLAALRPACPPTTAKPALLCHNGYMRPAVDSFSTTLPPPLPTLLAAEAMARENQELRETNQELEQMYLNLVAETKNDRHANRAALELTVRLTDSFGRGWCLLAPNGAAVRPPPEWRTVAACNTRRLD